MMHEHVTRAEARMLAALVIAGQRAAALDGRHLFTWGMLAAAVLGFQYVAETRDWLPSRTLWLWQPMALAGFVASIFLARLGAGRRLGNPVSRSYALGFAAAGCCLALYLLVAGAEDVPDGLTAVLLLSAGFGCAFMMLATAAHLRWMALPAAGWWALMIFYLSVDKIVPFDWLRLAAAFLALIALPGAVLIRKGQK